MRTTRITDEQRQGAFAPTKKPEVIERQKLDVRYHVEDFDVDNRPKRFLEAFAAILRHCTRRPATRRIYRASDPNCC